MYSSEDLERFYLDYQSEWVPRGMTLQAHCSRNNVPYKVMENYLRNIQKKIVEVKVVGRPTEEPQQSVASSPSSVQQQSEQSFKRELKRSISVAIRFGEYASTFPHCSMKSSEYLWPKTKRLVKDERRSKSKLRVCA